MSIVVLHVNWGNKNSNTNRSMFKILLKDVDLYSWLGGPIDTYFMCMFHSKY